MSTALITAQQLLAAGQVAQAEVHLLPALSRTAERAEAHYLMSVAGVLGARPADAVTHALAAVAEQPVQARYHFALGRARKLSAQLPEAIAAYRQAIRLDAGYAEAHVSLGIALKHSGDIKAAVRCYERAISLRPDFTVAHVNLAYARAALAEREIEAGADHPPPNEAIVQTERAAAADPGNPTLQFNLGLLLRRARRRADAIGAFNRALGISPRSLVYCLYLAHELTAGGAFKSAIVLYERWQELNPPNPTVMRALANLLVREGSASAAVQWSERAAALEPDPKAYLSPTRPAERCDAER